MNQKELQKLAADTVISFAREEAENALKSLSEADIEALVEPQMQNLIQPLEEEIASTSSWWVKIRNRFYVAVMRRAVRIIITDIKQKLSESLAKEA